MNHPAQPLANTRCPLCGQSNDCAAALSGRFDVPCWCVDAGFPPELLARVPEDQRHQACICPRCAGVAEASEGGVSAYESPEA